VLRDRVNLTAKSKWLDQNGRYYIIYTREKVAKFTTWSLRKTVDVFHALANAGLIVEEKQTNRAKRNIAPRIYVKQWAAPVYSDSNEELPYLTPSNIAIRPSHYYIIPCDLFGSRYKSLSLRAKLLYAIILDTLHLSIEFGHRDNDGVPWCELRQQEIMSLLDCKATSLAKAYHELECCGLIYRKRVESGCAMRIYARPCWTTEPPQDLQGIATTPAPQYTDTMQGSTTQCASQNPVSCTQVNFTQSKPGIYSHRDSIKVEDVPSKEDIQSQIDIWGIEQDMLQLLSLQESAMVHEILSLAVDVMLKDAASSRQKIRVGQDYISRHELLEAYSMIDRYIMDTLLYKLVQRWDDVQDKVSYLRVALYRAHEDHAEEAYFTQCELGLDIVDDSRSDF
jgi:hypothetical protein